MSVRRVIVFATALAALPLVIAPAAVASAPAKTLVFEVTLRPAGSNTHSLPGDITYGQGSLVGATTWGRRSATVDWMCSHISTGGTGPANDLVTITRSDGAVLALAVSGWVSDGTLRGTVDVIGGKGAYRGATGTGTVVGRNGAATLSLTVSQSNAGRAVSRHGVGC